MCICNHISISICFQVQQVQEHDPSSQFSGRSRCRVLVTAASDVTCSIFLTTSPLCSQPWENLKWHHDHLSKRNGQISNRVTSTFFTFLENLLFRTWHWAFNCTSAVCCSRKCILVWWIFDKMIKYAPTPTCFGQKHETNRAVAVWCGVWSICGRRGIISVDRLAIFPKEDALYIGLGCDVIIKIQEKYYLWTMVDLSSKTGNHSCLDWEISTKRNFAESP